MDSPYILKENDDYAVVYKPPKMHCAPLNTEEDNTLCAFVRLCGLNSYFLMHRLDYETNGLVLFAKNEKSYNFFKSAQENGEFYKEYSAICAPTDNKLIEGFPDYQKDTEEIKVPMIIESYFRPYGPGRKQVRPVIEYGKKHKEIAKDKGGFYKTEITNIKDNIVTARIYRGFRHQIRCHLFWIGYPIQNDPLYCHTAPAGNVLALRSHALFFPDPSNGKQLEYRIEALE